MPEITMYGADWCGDCLRTKAFFAANNVTYEYVDVAADPSQMAEVLRRNEGRQSIPVVVFADGSHLTEPSADELAQKLSI